MQEMQVTAGCITSQNFYFLNSSHFYCVENSTFAGGEMTNLSGFANALHFSNTSLLLEGLFVLFLMSL